MGSPVPPAPTTGLVRHAAFLAHDTGSGHPERAQRLRALHEGLERSGLLAHLDARDPREATTDELTAVHGAAVVARARAVCERGGGLLDGSDTVVCRESWDAAVLAAGGSIDACLRVLEGTWRNAFVACRPPGHHAESDASMGFCVFNNVAAAAAALRARGVARVAIVDFDVHHGNGTQEIFWEDPSVLYASLHQFPWYPGTGAARERGAGDGDGATVNCPMPSGSGDAEWLRAFDGTVVPALDAFAPEFVLVSAGFDAHVADPLSGTRLTEAAYARMTEALLDVARRHAGGRLVACLEGGYDLRALASCAETHVAALVAT